MDVYSRRRARLRQRLGSGAAALLASPEVSHRNADNEYGYRPDSNLLYLSGFTEPEAVLLVLPEEHASPFVMFVPPRDPELEVWSGRRAGPEGACERFGANAAHALEELESKLEGYLEHVSELYVPFDASAPLTASAFRVIRKLQRRKYKPVAGPRKLGDLRLVLGAMRRLKDPEEIEIMRKACAISAAGHLAGWAAIRPGATEYEVEAAIQHAFRKAGANGPSYEIIVGSGANATVLHYVANSATIAENDAVLIDAGAEFGYYAGDITRTYPASGRFTPAQRELYAIVLEAEKKAIAAAQPGAHVRTPHEVARATIIDGLRELGLLHGSTDEIVENETFKRFFMHGTSHYLGLDVHDAGEYYFLDGKPMPFEPGMVLTVEPGIYVAPDDMDAPEAYRGIGVRIEDDVLITADGNDVLTNGVPREIADLEGR